MPKIYEKKIKQNCRPGSVYIPIKETSETLKPITCYQSIIVACHNAKKKREESLLYNSPADIEDTMQRVVQEASWGYSGREKK